MPNYVEECPARRAYKWRVEPGILRSGEEGYADVCMIEVLVNDRHSLNDIRTGPSKCNSCHLRRLIGDASESPKLHAEFDDFDGCVERFIMKMSSVVKERGEGVRRSEPSN